MLTIHGKKVSVFKFCDFAAEYVVDEINEGKPVNGIMFAEAIDAYMDKLQGDEELAAEEERVRDIENESS